ALAPFSVLAGGKHRTDEEEQRRKEAGRKGALWLVIGNELILKVAKDIGARSISAAATAYVVQKMPYEFPIIGGRKIENLKDNIEALDLT
ncbi:hypothetical protein BDP27DRAFT_1239720, partial [Rhodocollybia butyracea]